MTLCVSSTLFIKTMPRLSKDRELPEAIKNIRLGAALQDCGNRHVADAFDKSNADILFVYDDNELGHTDWTDTVPHFEEKCFVAENPRHSVVALLPLDGCIITGKKIMEGGVCDGMLLTEKEMCLVEFKTNVASPNYKTIIQRANEAIGQLWHTYDGIVRPRCARFRGIEGMLTIEFYVVFDKTLEVTGANAELMDLQNQFLEDNNFVIYFANKKIFH